VRVEITVMSVLITFVHVTITMRVEIILVRVVITFISVKITYECQNQNHTLLVEITLMCAEITLCV
jgi:hypothetical protein